MADTNKVFGLIRTICMSLSILLSILGLITAATMIKYSLTHRGYYMSYGAFGIAVAGLTILTVPVMLFISIYRKGAFTSMVVVELCWLGFLWILWLIVGSTVASIPWTGSCWGLSFSFQCTKAKVMAGIAFFNWLVFLVPNITLLSLAIKQRGRGYNIWTNYVTDADFGAPAVNLAMAPMDAKGAIPQPQLIPPQSSPFQQPPQFPGSIQPTDFTTPLNCPQLRSQYMSMPLVAQV